MAAVNYYLGLKRGYGTNPGAVVYNTSSGNTAADVELRIQINDGSNATGITRKDVLLLIDVLEDFIVQGGITGDAGTDLPAL